MMKKTALFIYSLIFFTTCFAQYDAPLYTAYTTKAARARMNEMIVKNVITKALEQPLTEDTEEGWQDAFNAMEVYLYTSPFTTAKISGAFAGVADRSPAFKRALLEVVYTLYPKDYPEEVFELMKGTNSPRIFAMGAEYLMRDKQEKLIAEIPAEMNRIFRDDVWTDPTLFVLSQRLQGAQQSTVSFEKLFTELFKKSFLPGNTVLYSIQRPDRDFPGLAIIRNGAGNFVTDSNGNILTIPLLARSITNLPWYVRNGNTPQGIFSMYGFGVSMSNFIGPTANIQMGMPFELSKQKFLQTNFSADSEWTKKDYQNLLPVSLQHYEPLYGSFYAGKIGRNEIILHGTTVEPELYTGKPYFPLTPTMGCLTTKEIWDGRRIESDQQAMVNALLKAGGARGYVVVVETDDRQEAVSLAELLSFLPES